MSIGATSYIQMCLAASRIAIRHLPFVEPLNADLQYTHSDCMAGSGMIDAPIMMYNSRLRRITMTEHIDVAPDGRWDGVNEDECRRRESEREREQERERGGKRDERDEHTEGKAKNGCVWVR
ncbi:hypothetical protein HWV62_22367 [Athelia sp. TMB]|nr:hypothetical protein HWV62_22367 [Athelia sp. TMB]